MKLQQDQVWKVEDTFLRIVQWDRMAIGYKEMKDLTSKEGSLHQVSKKEFCRMIKPGVLLTPEQVRELRAAGETASEPPEILL